MNKDKPPLLTIYKCYAGISLPAMKPKEWDKLKPQSLYKDWGSECFNDGVDGGGDAMWRIVCDYIADLSNKCCDDKEFRVKLFLWLTKRDEDDD